MLDKKTALFFNLCGKSKIKIGNGGFTAEDVYQYFKNRLISEVVCDVWGSPCYGKLTTEKKENKE